MNTSKKIPAGGGKFYCAPSIELNVVNAEGGFCLSGVNGSATHQGLGDEYELGYNN